MKLVRTYLLGNGSMPMGVAAGHVRPNGKTIDCWALASSPLALHVGSTPMMNSKPVNGALLRSAGFLVRINVFEPG